MQLFYLGTVAVVCSAILLTLGYKVYVCLSHLINGRPADQWMPPVDVERALTPPSSRRDTEGDLHFQTAISPACGRRYSNSSAVTVCQVHIPRRYSPPPSYEEAISHDAVSMSIPSRIRTISMASNV